VTGDLPAPLVPAEVDLRGMSWMPYYGDHLARSQLNARVSDAAYRAAHNLWWAAWNNVPAASLDDDEILLARAADLGRDIRTFKKIREEALHGFVKCTDGRLYHKFLASLAIHAWERRLKDRDRKRSWRGTRRGQDGDGTGTGRGRDSLVPLGRNVPVPDERRGEDRKGQDRRKGEDSEPNGSAEAINVKEIVFGKCLSWVADKTGRPPDGFRSLFGRWCKDYGDAAVIDAIMAAQREEPIEPIAWLTARLASSGKLRRRAGVVGGITPMHPGAGG
jgi:hypothetical protein